MLVTSRNQNLAMKFIFQKARTRASKSFQPRATQS